MAWCKNLAEAGMCGGLRIRDGLVVASVGLKARIESMSPVSATTLVIARSCSSLLVMGSLLSSGFSTLNVAPRLALFKRPYSAGFGSEDAREAAGGAGGGADCTAGGAAGDASGSWYLVAS